MSLAMDSQAVMAGTHGQNLEMDVQKAKKLRGVNNVDLNKTALRIPVPGTSAFSPRLHPAAGTVPQRRLTEGSPLEVGLLFRTPRSSASSSLGVYRCVSNRERRGRGAITACDATTTRRNTEANSRGDFPASLSEKK